MSVKSLCESSHRYPGDVFGLPLECFLVVAGTGQEQAAKGLLVRRGQGAGECPVLGCRVLERQLGAVSAGARGTGGGEKAPWIMSSALANPVEIMWSALMNPVDIT